MGSITKKGNKLTVTLEIKRIMVSQISFVGNQAVEGMTFKAAVANLALKLVREKAPDLVDKKHFSKSTIDLTEDEKSVVVTFEE